MAQTECDWATYTWKNPDGRMWQIIAFERVSPDHAIAVQMYPSNMWCYFVGEKVPEHKKRSWERELEKLNAA